MIIGSKDYNLTGSKLSTEIENQRLFWHRTIIDHWNKGLMSPRNQNKYRSESEIVQAQDIIGSHRNLAQYSTVDHIQDRN